MYNNNTNQIMHVLDTHKILTYKFFIRRAFLVCTENNLDNKLDNACRIAHNGFKVTQINKLIVDIANNKNSEYEFDSQKYKFYTIKYFPNFLKN